MGCEHHAYAVVTDIVDESLVDDLGGGGVEGSGGFVGEEEQGLLRQLPGHDHTLLLPSGQVPGYVGGPVGEVDHLDHLDGALDTVGLLVVDGLHDVLYDGFVTEEGEGPLKHDCHTCLDIGLEGVGVLEGPVVHIEPLGLPAAYGTGDAGIGEVEVSALATAVDVVDDTSTVGV